MTRLNESEICRIVMASGRVAAECGCVALKFRTVESAEIRLTLLRRSWTCRTRIVRPLKAAMRLSYSQNPRI